MQDSQSSISSKFSAAYRLQRADGFDHVMRAENIANKHFKIFFGRNNMNHARLGMIVSKKTLASATDRNFVKRTIREKFRQHNLRFCKLDLIVMVKHDYFHGDDTRFNNLERLFNQVENKCAEW